jgi:hypothetical protein
MGSHRAVRGGVDPADRADLGEVVMGWEEDVYKTKPMDIIWYVAWADGERIDLRRKERRPAWVSQRKGGLMTDKDKRDIAKGMALGTLAAFIIACIVMWIVRF